MYILRSLILAGLIVHLPVMGAPTIAEADPVVTENTEQVTTEAEELSESSTSDYSKPLRRQKSKKNLKLPDGSAAAVEESSIRNTVLMGIVALAAIIAIGAGTQGTAGN